MLADCNIGEFAENPQLTLIEDVDLKSNAGVEIEIREDGRVPTVSPEIYQNTLKNIEILINQITRIIAQ